MLKRAKEAARRVGLQGVTSFRLGRAKGRARVGLGLGVTSSRLGEIETLALTS